jgi:hypothetical protein
MSKVLNSRVSIALAAFVAAQAPFAFAQEKLEGRVVDTKLTACGVVAGKPGKCEGTFVLESNGKQAAVKVTRDTVLKKGNEQPFLFQLKGAPVTVTMGRDNVARLVEVKK